MNTTTARLLGDIKLAMLPLEAMVGNLTVRVALQDPNYVVTELLPCIREISGHRPFSVELRQFIMEEGQTRSEVAIFFENGSQYKGTGESSLPEYATLVAFYKVIPEIERAYQYYPVGQGWGV